MTGFSENFMNKANRDKRYRELKAQGRVVVRRSYGPSRMHPMYIKDWPYELTAEDKGFGNTLYRTYFPKFYSVEVAR